jgi:hypothetical protein
MMFTKMKGMFTMMTTTRPNIINQIRSRESILSPSPMSQNPIPITMRPVFFLFFLTLYIDGFVVEEAIGKEAVIRASQEGIDVSPVTT